MSSHPVSTVSGLAIQLFFVHFTARHQGSEQQFSMLWSAGTAAEMWEAASEATRALWISHAELLAEACGVETYRLPEADQKMAGAHKGTVQLDIYERVIRLQCKSPQQTHELPDRQRIRRQNRMLMLAALHRLIAQLQCSCTECQADQAALERDAEVEQAAEGAVRH